MSLQINSHDIFLTFAELSNERAFPAVRGWQLAVGGMAAIGQGGLRLRQL